MIMYDWLRISGVWSILRGVEHYYLEFLWLLLWVVVV